MGNFIFPIHSSSSTVHCGVQDTKLGRFLPKSEQIQRTFWCFLNGICNAEAASI